ncbi:hypothetical protein Q0F99_18035 [Rathayibacter oskolensis]|uniref:hypothetical protein n=1 Tax=Rathayibacter oskolensis TaxID=1891671 RepID=UPI00265E5C24|nr:hypothetical protein [Rathayibacter oskolensis]WKK71320.1 hypothetical protein Q0F99_18035 [Rathayibacter oskolensis]
MRGSRAANAAGVWIILGTFVLCGVGNAVGTPSADALRIESAWPAWLSPFGWVENTRPYDVDDLRPLLLCAVVAIAATGGAFALHASRDSGAGLLPERRGRASAGCPAGRSARARLAARPRRRARLGGRRGADGAARHAPRGGARRGQRADPLRAGADPRPRAERPRSSRARS